MKNWLYNIGLGGLLIALVTALIFYSLGFYTHHGETIQVPNLVSLKPFEAEAKVAELNLRMKIIDTVYLPNTKPGCIVKQFPEAFEFVKTNRSIYLTVNALSSPRVPMPKLTDCSFNLAKALIKNAGLVLGEVVYQFSEEENNLVVAQRIRGQIIEPGQKISKGSLIDITVLTTKKEFQEDTDIEEIDNSEIDTEEIDTEEIDNSEIDNN